MKIGILTQPLKNNYGGLLQAYALQKVLNDMGHEVWIINRTFKEPSFVRQYASLGKRIILKYILKKSLHPIFIFNPTKEEQKIIATYTSQFVKKHFPHVTKKIIRNKDMIHLNREGFDAYMVGSDQVWRPRYSPCITNYFLDFVEKGTKIKRIIYAASFGVSDWEFTEEQTRDCSRLAKYFNAVSVREDSGVDLCRKYLGVDAVHVLDPTMLLNTKDYIHLLENEGKSSGNMMTYILDKTNEKKQMINDISKRLKLLPFSVMPNKMLTKETRGTEIKECIYPPVTKWLRGFIDAEFVVTDSFHGCIFSILFNKPFIVIGNPKRGMSRFNSLLKLFDLEDRLVNVTETNYNNLFIEEINWTKVNAILMTKRKEASLFLTKYLPQ